jgi:hypothetical protein
MTQHSASISLAARGEARLASLYGSCDQRAQAWITARRRLEALGITADIEAAIRRNRCGHFCGIARVRPHGGRYFDFDDAGRWCCLLPELWCEEIVDLVAFALRPPNFLATYCGLTPLLGEEGVARDIFVTGETMLWDDPLQWLRARCEGGVLLEFDPPPAVLHGGRIKCGSFALAERLQAALAAPRVLAEVRAPKGGVAA